MAVFARLSVRRWASRSVPQSKSLLLRSTPGVISKVEICTKRKGKLPSRHLERQSVISAGKRVEYMPACDSKLLDSPWYQITPLIGKGVKGAIMPLKSPAGAKDSGPGCHGCTESGLLACLASSSERSSSAVAKEISACSSIIFE